MSQSKLRSFLGISITLLCLIAVPLQSHAADKSKTKAAHSAKERLVLMPIRVPEEDKNLTGAMETALVKGLQQKYDVFSGERVAQKAHEIFMKESRNTAHTECDETRCMQNIAEAFQAELIATANVTKQDGSYFLAISIQNIFDNKVEYSESLPCKNCDATQVVEKLKELSGSIETAPAQTDHQEKKPTKSKETDDIKQASKVTPPSSQKQNEKADSTQTPEQKFSAMLKKANAGDADAQRDIAFKYFLGEGVKKNDSRGMVYLQKAAEIGDLESQLKLAELCYGTVILRDVHVKKDLLKGAFWYRKAADNGEARAQNMIGYFYEFGKEGFPKDATLAAEWYRKSFEGFSKTDNQSSNPEIQVNLGHMYFNGRGTPKDDLKAADLYQKAAVQGNVNAQYNISWMYSKGAGVKKDMILAYAWANLAASQGNENAKKLRDSSASELNPAEKIESQVLSSNWKVGHALVREGK